MNCDGVGIIYVIVPRVTDFWLLTHIVIRESSVFYMINIMTSLRNLRVRVKVRVCNVNL